MRVGIIIPTCDRPTLLLRAVASALNQTKQPHAVVVANDGLIPLPHLPQQVTLVSTGGYKGPSAARAAAMQKIDVDAVTYVDDDDELLPNHVRVLSDALKEGHAFAFSKAIYRERGVDQEGDCTYDSKLLHERNIAPISCFMHTTWALEAVGGWDPLVARLEDWDVWGRMAVEFGEPKHVALITNIIHRRENGHIHLSDNNNFAYSLMCSWRDMVADRISFARNAGRGKLTNEERKRMSMPKVGVVLPVYNASRFLRQAIDSILCQSFQDFEILAINDHSSDDSLAILEQYSSQDKRVRVFDNMAENGVTPTLNFGLLVSRSPYIARMDADDVSMPKRLEHQVAFLDQSPKIAVLGTRFLSMSEDLSKVIWDNPIETDPMQVNEALKRYCCIGHPTVMFRRRLVETIGGYESTPEKHAVEDYDLWIRASKSFSLANLPVMLLHHRIHDQQVSKRLSLIQATNAEALRRGGRS